MTLSWRAGRPIDTPSASTYADGIAARVSIPAAVALMAGRVDDMVLVSEEALHAAQATLTDELGVTVEGAAGAAWAGVKAIPRPAGRRPARHHGEQYLTGTGPRGMTDHAVVIAGAVRLG